jgi:hypothetical protein
LVAQNSLRRRNINYLQHPLPTPRATGKLQREPCQNQDWKQARQTRQTETTQKRATMRWKGKFHDGRRDPLPL